MKIQRRRYGVSYAVYAALATQMALEIDKQTMTSTTLPVGKLPVWPELWTPTAHEYAVDLIASFFEEYYHTLPFWMMSNMWPDTTLEAITQGINFTLMQRKLPGKFVEYEKESDVYEKVFRRSSTADYRCNIRIYHNMNDLCLFLNSKEMTEIAKLLPDSFLLTMLRGNVSLSQIKYIEGSQCCHVKEILTYRNEEEFTKATT